jgi:hypothetical protein
MKIKYLLLILVSFKALASCDQFIEVELPGQEPRMVMNSLLDPTDTLKVFLTKSKGVLESGNYWEDFELVEGANVYLKDQQGQIFPLDYINRSRPYETNAFYYLTNHDFIEGQTYEIIAEKEGFPTVSSIQRLPEIILINSIEIVNVGPVEGLENHDLFEVTVKFDDPPGDNFYELSGRILGREIYIVNGDTSFFYYGSDLYPRPVNPAYKKDFTMKSGLLINDNLLSGPDSEIVFRTSIRKNVNLDVTINLSHVSESYFRYYETTDLQQNNRGDILSQPVLVFNNVTNGLGIFKSRNTDQRVIEMRVEN